MDLLSRDADKACRGIKLNILKQEAGEIYRMQTTIETSANERTNDKVLQRKSIEVDAQCESQIWGSSAVVWVGVVFPPGTPKKSGKTTIGWETSTKRRI